MLVESRDVGDGVRILMLNRPPANAINAEFLSALGAQCKSAREDANVRAVVVAGNGKFFSGGLDLKEAASGANRVGQSGWFARRWSVHVMDAAETDCRDG
jgi:enoyl-CoA hydratase/carnithine racemase